MPEVFEILRPIGSTSYLNQSSKDFCNYVKPRVHNWWKIFLTRCRVAGAPHWRRKCLWRSKMVIMWNVTGDDILNTRMNFQVIAPPPVICCTRMRKMKYKGWERWSTKDERWSTKDEKDEVQRWWRMKCKQKRKYKYSCCWMWFQKLVKSVIKKSYNKIN
jgi:hypothetical protein